MKKITKRLLMVVIVLAVVISAVLGFALYNANRLIARFKPQLEQQISGLIGTRITFDTIEASVFPQTALEVSGFKAESEEPGPTFERLILNLDLKALLQGALEVTKLELVRPSAVLIKDKNGIRVRGIAIKKEGESGKVATDAAPVQAPAATPDTPGASAPLRINVQTIGVTEGSIAIQDLGNGQVWKVENVAASSEISILGKDIQAKNLAVSMLLLAKHKLDLRVPSFSFARNEVDAPAYTVDVFGATLTGALRYALASKTGAVTLQSDGLDLRTIVLAAEEFSPEAGKYQLVGKIQPDLKFTLGGPPGFLGGGRVGLSSINAQHGSFDIRNLQGNLAVSAEGLKNTKVKSEDISLSVNEKPVTAAFTAELKEKALSVTELALQLLGGRTIGKIDFDLDTKRFASDIAASTIDISQALQLIRADESTVSGSIRSFDAKLKGELGPQLLNSLRGPVTVSVHDGTLKGFNLGALVLKAVNNLPFLTGALSDQVPSSEVAALNASDTAFKLLESRLAFSDGTNIEVQGLKMEAPIYVLESNGKLGLDKQVDLAATIFFDAKFSEQLAARAKDLRSVFDEGKRLVIPLRLEGTPPRILVYPNVKKLVEVAGKRIIMDKASGALKGVLEKRGLGGLGSAFGF